jgi:hypothetical protein
MRSKNPTLKPAVPTRPNAGHKLSIVRRDLGNGTHEMDIELSDAPFPERRYTADIAAVVKVKDYARIIFGQTKIGGLGCRKL